MAIPSRPRALAALSIALALAGACAPPASRAPERATLPPARPAALPIAPAPAAPACVPPETVAELACPAPPGGAVPAPFAWPSPDHLFHYPPRRPWVSPALPVALTEEAARLAAASRDPASRLLEAAEHATEDAVVKTATLAVDAKTRAPIDGAWKAARDGYAAFLKAAPPDHPLRGYALGRQARALANLGQVEDALPVIVAELAYLRANAGSPGAAVLAEVASRELGALQGRSKKTADEALVALRAAGLDPATTNELLMHVAEGYAGAGRHDAARAVLGDLAGRAAGAVRCTLEARKLASWITQQPAHRKRLLGLVEEQVTLAKQVAPRGSSGGDEEACRAETLAIVIELAVAWHAEAIGRKNLRGTGDMVTMKGVERLYRILDEDFDDGELRSERLAWIPSGSRPTRARVRFAAGDLLAWEKDWEKCGPLYERAYATAPDDATRASAALAAASCYHNLVRDSARVEAPKAVPLGAREKKLIEWSGRFLCSAAPEALDVSSHDRRLEIELTRGIAFYHAHDWARAAAALERLAFEAGHPTARQAATLYLVALHRLREEGRATCGEQLDRDQARLLALHCAGADDDEPSAPRIVGVTVAGTRMVTPCEAIRAIGAPPPPPPSPPPRSYPPAFRGGDGTMVNGTVLPEYVAWVMRLHAGELQACHDAALRRNPYLEGQQWLNLVVARDGRVSTASSESGRSVDADPDLDACVRRVALGMSFCQPEGGVLDVHWSLTLSRTRGAHFTREPRVTHP